jgi:Na+/H+ antiporter NhaD/arsenite permease-like protein
MNEHISPWSIIPFVGMLASIAAVPIVAEKFWMSNRNKLLLALGFAIPVAVYLIALGEYNALQHTILYDYVPFVVLMGGLFIITGNIFVDADFEGTPLVNTGFLALGAVLASVIGTTGASMLLIRPLLHTNRGRGRVVHTAIFFIVIVANTGGLCTPLGDPPLFMLYLRGVPFPWFLGLFPVWLFVNGALLAVYFGIDRWHHMRETASALEADRRETQPLVVHGAWNLVWLTLVIAAVAFLNDTAIPALHSFPFVREAVIAVCAAASYAFTSHAVREQNDFSWHPLEEVAVLFLGIFVTMIPCILYLENHATALGITLPVQFFYATGILSAVLDNAPTALTFHALASGLDWHNVALVAGVPDGVLRSIAASSVLFGGLTYIGNGPNLLIKSLAESYGVRMPHFFGYMVWTVLCALPVFVLVQWLLL